MIKSHFPSSLVCCIASVKCSQCDLESDHASWIISVTVK